jgi:UDP-N-acetylmuramyl pentapeptide phosphotransferase/UDP-N-acetylglucosamine-1-phosphate transferase
MPKKYKWTIRLGLLSLPLLLVAILFAGGGHGSIIPTIVLFPFAVLSFPTENEGLIFLLALGQFLFYGLMIDKFKNPKQREKLVQILIAFHMVISYSVWEWWRRKHGA